MQDARNQAENRHQQWSARDIQYMLEILTESEKSCNNNKVRGKPMHALILCASSQISTPSQTPSPVPPFATPASSLPVLVEYELFLAWKLIASLRHSYSYDFPDRISTSLNSADTSAAYHYCVSRSKTWVGGVASGPLCLFCESLQVGKL